MVEIDPAKPLAALKRRIVFENDGAVLSDIGDGVVCFEHKTKMNIYDENVFAAIGAALVETPKAFRAHVVGNDHPRAFSCGADLGYFLGRMKAGDYAGIEAFLVSGQERFLSLKYAPFPIVGAGHGLALGGGAETLLHVHEVVTHAELSAGVPELTLGILPGWGGCTQMILRWREKQAAAKDPAGSLADPFFVILGGRFSGTAQHAVDMGFLRPTDPIVTSGPHVLARAKARAIERAEAGWTPKGPRGPVPSRPVGQSLADVGGAFAGGSRAFQRQRSRGRRRARDHLDRRSHQLARAHDRTSGDGVRARSDDFARPSARDFRADRTYARNRQAAQELRSPMAKRSMAGGCAATAGLAEGQSAFVARRRRARTGA